VSDRQKSEHVSQGTKHPSEAAGTAPELTVVRTWRREQFHDLGFTLTEAYELADAPVDLDIARRIMAAGCSTQTAIRILL
jgi:hypothetical protein